MCTLHDTPHKPSSHITYPTLPNNIEHDVKRVPCALLQPFMPQTLRKDPSAALSRAERRERATPNICEETRVDGASRSRTVYGEAALRTPTEAGAISSSHDGEKEGMREDWSVYCALADLGMEERVKGGWCVCVAPLGHRTYCIVLRSCVRVTLTLKVTRCGA